MSRVCLDSKSITLIVPKSMTPALVVWYLKLVSKHAPAVNGPIRTSGVSVSTLFCSAVSCIPAAIAVSLNEARLSKCGFAEATELLLCAVTKANLRLRLLLFKHWTWTSTIEPCDVVGGAVNVKMISPSLAGLCAPSCTGGRELF
jgi:hypothetical protein